MKEKQIILEMYKIYGKPNKCWMGYQITAKNYVSFHHILEKRNGGKDDINNGALLSRKSHIILHQLEELNPELYEEYTYWFKIINERKSPLTEEIKAIMASLRKRAIKTLEIEKEKKQHTNKK